MELLRCDSIFDSADSRDAELSFFASGLFAAVSKVSSHPEYGDDRPSDGGRRDEGVAGDDEDGGEYPEETEGSA